MANSREFVCEDCKVNVFEFETVMPETNKTVWETAREPVRLSYEKRKDQPLQIGVER